MPLFFRGFAASRSVVSAADTHEKVRPGGLILFVASKDTMDNIDGGLREYVAHQADLIGAIRLPNDAFNKNANTEVTTDIVILFKRLAHSANTNCLRAHVVGASKTYTMVAAAMELRRLGLPSQFTTSN